MKWLDADQIEAWSRRVDARTRLSEIVAQLVRASAAGMTDYDFPTGDSAQRPGFDGRLTAVPAHGFEQFLPEGTSVWEYGTRQDYHEKANEDYETRTENPGAAIDLAQTTLVIVTGRRWNRTNPTLADWIAAKREEQRWKDVRALDAIALEAWLDLCPAVAAAVAREVLGTLPETGAISPQEFWEEYSSQFEPHLRPEVLLAGRKEQSEVLLRELSDGPQLHRWQGDSLNEVLAFMVAGIMSAPENDRKFLESRTLLVETREAARLLNGRQNLIFAVHGDAWSMAGALSNLHPVLVPLGRDSLRDGAATRLNRPSIYEMSEALKSMALSEDDSRRLALECDRSVTVLARRIPSAVAKRPAWHGDVTLIPALLAGAWDTSFENDRSIIARLANLGDYQQFEAAVRRYRQVEDAPLETVDTVWAVRAPVDVFVNLANLLGQEYFARLRDVTIEVFAEIDPALDLAIEDRPFARMRGARVRHSPWLREGLANTLLILAAIGEKSGVTIDGVSPQLFVNSLIANIPSLRENSRVIASLSHELPLLMEAAPGPLLFALEQLLGGDGAKILPIFQDSSKHTSIFTSSPHTGLLWALELIAWDPDYLLTACTALLKLAALDPGGALANRPSRSLRNIFLSWRPATNASLVQRLAVLDSLIAQNEPVAWRLLMSLLPKGFDSAEVGPKPKFREAGASDRETITHGLLYESYEATVARAVSLAGTSSQRWADLLDTIHTFSDPQRELAIQKLSQSIEAMDERDKSELWEKLGKTARHHRAFPGAPWSLSKDVLGRLEEILKRIEPADPLQQSLWLFEESFPLIENEEGKDFLEHAQRLRKEAIERLTKARGAEGALDLAELAKAPRFIGLALGQVLPGAQDLVGAALAAFARGPRFNGFVSLLSVAAIERFDEDWRRHIREQRDLGNLTDSQVVTLVLAWPHEPKTWNFVGLFGDGVVTLYWQERDAWSIRGGNAELKIAVENYLAVNRAEIVVTELHTKIGAIESRLLLQTLDQFEQRLADEPNLRDAQNLYFYLEQIFNSLRGREDVTSAEVAIREYRYLPFLGQSRVYGRDSHSLELDGFMVQSPEFYVRILSDVYVPASEKGQQREVSEQERARARIGSALLDGFTSIPGRINDEIDAEQLKAWVAEVRRLAEQADRLAIAEEKIGALLAHSPKDPSDGLWPHRAIRDCFEGWSSEAIERGMTIEKINMRGVTKRLPRDGGRQERDLAESQRNAAKQLDRWPRAQRILRELAAHWDEAAKREDIRAEQLELRE